MSGMKAKLIRDEPGVCPACGDKTVTEVYASECKPCRAVKYLLFRDAFNWPLDAEEMKQLGFIP